MRICELLAALAGLTEHVEAAARHRHTVSGVR